MSGASSRPIAPTFARAWLYMAFGQVPAVAGMLNGIKRAVSKTVASHGPAVIDDESPPPPHARFGWGRFAKVLASFVAIWLLGVGGLTAVFGWDGP